MAYSLLRNRITFVWLGLVIATCLSWETGGDFHAALDFRMASIIVLGIAFLKVRYVILEFMELRHAPLAMRLIAEAWTVLVGAAVIGFYWVTRA